MLRGVFIAIDGIDGSGKATQAKLLAERIKKEKKRVRVFDFPQYGKKSAGAVEEYLNGKYGPASEVPPEVASYFFAIDRYDASFAIRQALADGEIVIADRYIAANIGHQGGGFSRDRRKWLRYVEWLEHLEYDVFSIPKPDAYFIFMISPDLSRRSSGRNTDPEKIEKRTSYLGKKRQDILERDGAHLKSALQSYRWLVSKYPKRFTPVDCAPSGVFRPIQEIHEEIWKKVAPLIN